MTNNVEKIIAFDLSLSNTGYAVGEVTDGKISIIEVGSISTKRFTRRPLGFRLNHIAQNVKKIFTEHPDAGAVVKERSFSNGRITATQRIFMVNGVWELVAYLNGVDEYTDIAPNSVKKTVTGNGRASKQVVAKKVAELTDVETNNNDESDAVAVLIAYCRQEELLDEENEEALT